MFKSVFAKYMTAFMLIIIVSFTILAAIISSMMLNYSKEMKREVVFSASQTVRQYLESQYTDYYKQNGGTFSEFVNSTRSKIQGSMSIFVRYTGNLILIAADSDGNILVTDPVADNEIIGKVIPGTIVRDVYADGYYQQSNLSGILNGQFVIQGVEVKHNGKDVGMVFACSDASSESGLVQVMIKTIIMVSLWVLLAALIAAYFISERIIGPLKDMGRAAKSFASGKFDVRVPVSGQDEVSELAVAFNNMASSLSRLEEMRRTFIGNVSHDLRTPMMTIHGFIDGILDGAIPPEKHAYYLNFIRGETERLSELINTLLDISRIQAGERKFNMSAFDVCEMARLIIISFEQQLDEKKLNVEFECESEKMLVYADRDAIYQILYNICHNAVKFSREGGVYRVKIISREKKIYVSVYNEGQGIAPDELPYVFDRFYKSDKSRGLDKSGVGLGLYIAKTIIDAHGEEIWVNSVYGESCEFVFTLTPANESQKKKLSKGTKQEQQTT